MNDDLFGDSQDREVPAEAQGDSPRLDDAAASELARLRAEKDEVTNTLVRRQADFENYRKRIERERQQDARRGMATVVEDLLPVLDAFERALHAQEGSGASDEYHKGVELIYRQLWDVLARHGVERILAAGMPFDPHIHQAIERVETRDYPDGTVIEVVQEGYMFHGRMLRPSVVRVAVETEPAGDGDSPAARQRAR